MPMAYRLMRVQSQESVPVGLQQQQEGRPSLQRQQRLRPQRHPQLRRLGRPCSTLRRGRLIITIARREKRPGRSLHKPAPWSQTAPSTVTEKSFLDLIKEGYRSISKRVKSRTAECGLMCTVSTWRSCVLFSLLVPENVMIMVLT